MNLHRRVISRKNAPPRGKVNVDTCMLLARQPPAPAVTR